MSITLNLTDLVNLQNETTAVNAINANNSAIISAFQDALALDGTSPNSMRSSLDMNSNSILNLPTPTSLYSPLRLLDANLLNGGGSIPLSPLPTGGLTGQVLVKNSVTNFDVSWSNTVANLVVTGSFNAPGIVTSSLLSSLPITLGSTAMTLGNVYSSISGPITFSGPLTLTSPLTLSAALTYGGITLSNAVTGTGNMVLSNAPTLTGTLTFGTLSPTSLAQSTNTITGLTVNSSPVAANDYLCYYSSANGAINKISVSNLISATTAGVTSLGSSTGVITLGGDLSISGNVLQDHWTTGDVKLTFKSIPDSGWFFMNDGTIGDASSGADRANADTAALFTLLWTNVGSTWAPVSGGYGVSAASDYAAHKKMTLPRMLGRTLASGGAGSGLVTYGLGNYTGENTHALIVSEIPSHNHGGVTSGQSVDHTHTFTAARNTTGFTAPGSGGPVTDARDTGLTTSGTSVDHTHSITAQGGGSAHNNMQPTSFLNVMIKL